MAPPSSRARLLIKVEFSIVRSRFSRSKLVALIAPPSLDALLFVKEQSMIFAVDQLKRNVPPKPR